MFPAEAILAQLDDAVVATDAAGVVTFWNAAAERAFGRAAGEAVGRDYADVVPLAAGAFAGRVRVAGRDGADVWVDARVQVVRDAAGRPGGTVGVYRDVTADVAVEERGRLKQAVVRHTRDVVLVTEAEPVGEPGPRIVYVNPAFTALTGYTEADALGRTPRMLQGPGTDPATLAQIRSALRAWKSARFELLNYKKDGTEFWVELDISPLADAAGWFTHWIAVQRDVTDRKRAELALRDSERLLREVMDATPNFVAVKDRAGRFVLANRAMAAGYGVAADDMAGRADADLSPDPAAAALSADAERRALAFGAAVHIPEEEFRTASGARVWLETTKVPLAGPGGAPDRVLCVAVNVTARREAAAALEESNRLYRLLADAGRDVVFLLDAAGRVEYVSPSSGRVFGSAPAGFAGQLLTDRAHPNDAAAVARSVADGSAGRPARAEWRCRHADGRDVWVESLAGPAGDGGRVVLTARDVTERRLLEDQFRQAQKLEAVGRLAAGVAHDFNNLLTVVGGCGELLADALAGRPARALAEDVLAAVARGAGLTRQLLAFSRRQAVRPVPLDLNAVAAGVAGMLGRLLGEDVALVLDPAPGLPAVRADAGLVEQVIMNLAVNARDAMPAGGTVTVRTAAVDVPGGGSGGHPPGLAAGRYVRLTVRDTGTGIAPDVRDRLFEPFFTTKPAGQGTGLGLATVHGIAHLFRGGVAVESAPGAGAAFHVYFPATDDAPAPPAGPAPAGHAPRGRETVLVVEDDAAVGTLTVTVLKRAGYEVLAAASGADAVRACGGHAGPVHLVLTDVIMPGVSGRELADELRVVRPGVRVAFQSGYTADVVLRRGVRHDDDLFLQKPYTARRLAEFVRAALDAGPGGGSGLGERGV